MKNVTTFIKNLGVVKLLYSRKASLLAIGLWVSREAWLETENATIVMGIFSAFVSIILGLSFQSGMKARIGGSNDPKDEKPAEGD